MSVPARSGFQDTSVNSPDLRRRRVPRGFGHAFGTGTRRTGTRSAQSPAPAHRSSTRPPSTRIDPPTASPGITLWPSKCTLKWFLKDAELVAIGPLRGAEWHFVQDAQDDLLAFLKQNGIK